MPERRDGPGIVVALAVLVGATLHQSRARDLHPGLTLSRLIHAAPAGGGLGHWIEPIVHTPMLPVCGLRVQLLMFNGGICALYGALHVITWSARKWPTLAVFC